MGGHRSAFAYSLRTRWNRHAIPGTPWAAMSSWTLGSPVVAGKEPAQPDDGGSRRESPLPPPVQDRLATYGETWRIYRKIAADALGGIVFPRKHAHGTLFGVVRTGSVQPGADVVGRSGTRASSMGT